MKLEDVASITVGQIMTRVSTDDESECIQKTKVLVPGAISGGIIETENLPENMLKKKIDSDKCTMTGDVVIKLSTPYDAAFITEECAGLAVPSFCAVIRPQNYNPLFLSAYLNTSYVRELLKSKVVGTARPMIKVTDLRNLDIPKLPERDMQDIGEAFRISGEKKALLREMLDTETEIMDAVILKCVAGGEF